MLRFSAPREREREVAPSVEAPHGSSDSTSEALVFTLSSQHQFALSPNPTSPCSHVSVSPLIFGGRANSLYPGVLGNADLADLESRQTLQ
jgi:hypothetical protein